MSFLSMLYTFFLMPIQLLFEVVFSYAYTLTGKKMGPAIIALSLAINLLILPLYRRADAMQEEERNTEARLKKGVDHIKKTFRGDERTMILQTYYRQNNYSPLYVLRSAVSLMLEIPFFIAAYRFLSGLSLLKGVSFGPIADLGKQDKLIVIGGLAINLLPVPMTAINVVSTAIFTKGYPLKTKLQLYGMAAFFLVFLYDSPSGLVFYWTLNNLFSLVKTVFYKISDPKKKLNILMLVCGVLMLGYGVYDAVKRNTAVNLTLYILIGLGLCVPFVMAIIRKKFPEKPDKVTPDPDKKLFWCGAVFLTLLTGVLIPSAVITASPTEFIIIGYYLHPAWYIVSSTLVAAGTFILWMGVFYWLFAPKTKVIFERVLLAACGIFTVNYLFFGNQFGSISSDLEFDEDLSYTLLTILINLAVVILTAAVILWITKKKVAIIKGVVLTAIVAVVCMAGINLFGIYSTIAKLDTSIYKTDDNSPTLTLSRSGKNVVVLMLDRSMGEYLPYILSEYPELASQYSGFTYYSNTISYGSHTNFGVPALFGGYEYTPVEINKRSDESLQSKHDESLMVMPVLFDESGWDVTVCDPPYAGYSEIPDLSIYDDYPDIDAYITQGVVMDPSMRTQTVTNRFRNFFCYSLTKSMPAFMQESLYDSGYYHQLDNTISTFDKNYEVLKRLPDITEIEDTGVNSFIMMENDTTHGSARFTDTDFNNRARSGQTPVDTSSITLGDRTLVLETKKQKAGYQVNIAALKRVAEWLNYLKAEGVYDNTRIIIAADHGYSYRSMTDLYIDETAEASVNKERHGDAEYYFPLLLVKDFGATGDLATSTEFMTNADVPTLATAGVIDNPVNPFTGKPINSDEKTAHPQYIIASSAYEIDVNNGDQFLPARWYSIHDDIWDMDNWELVAEDDVIDSYD